ncbi:5-oxoprolinase subunit PxpB [Paraglaciecola aquimarina]|uniref:5-oxoprolinase subunit PxpB n=1 Tax=Paraglaciecola aquimarina TaxID=1235557 RepID=A0ABU3T183_9ALTE|nr:5-oxoprolinase subunit PxpB [Paraglaciecola aquimarina]MDU0356034.1 5-oxoprolinase subunit PxpB [Paraglaciecola aquimarina]
MKSHQFSLENNGDSGINILFKQPISPALSRKIIALADICHIHFAGQVEQIVPAYQSLTLRYQPLKISYAQLTEQLHEILRSPLAEGDYQSKKVVIPVCYEMPYSLDLAKVAEHCKLTEQQVIERHCHSEYFVHMLGFSPGFLYLGGLAHELACPRKASPDLSVPAGSVGIGGSQTGIYPQNSPGGWHIIGRTPISLFDIEKPYPCVARPLDTLVFAPISATEFEQIESEKS